MDTQTVEAVTAIVDSFTTPPATPAAGTTHAATPQAPATTPKTETPKVELGADGKPIPPEPETQVKPDPAKEKDSQRFAAFARREKEIFQKTEALKARETALTQRETVVKSKEEWEKEARSNPIKALQGLGWTYKQITEHVLAGEKQTPEMVAKKAAEDAKDELRRELADQRKKEAEDAKKAAEEQQVLVIEEFRTNVANFIGTNSDQYEYCALYKEQAVDVIHEIAAQYALKTKRVISMEEAAELAEKYFDEQFEKAIATKKFKAKVTPQPQVDTKQTKDAPLRTITNQMTSTAPAKAQKPISREERIRRALAVGKNA